MRAGSLEVRGEESSYAAGGRRVGAHVAVPASGHGPGVVVIHEAWGLDAFVRGVCARLAREGLTALAPDLFDGRIARDLDEARELSAALDAQRVGEDLDGAVHALLSHDAVDGPRVGVLGFCLGGHLALVAASRSRRVGAVVDFYGLFPSPPLDLAPLAAPLLGIFAERDEFIPAESVEGLRRTLRAGGKRAEIVVQRGARHGFMNETRPDRFDAHAAALGWERLLAFLRAELA
jgi:carboxymethylenebutenolidase